MGMNCGCPAGAHLADLDNPSCSEGLGQIQKVIIQRIFSTGTTKNVIAATGSSSILHKATLTAKFAADDGTKMIITPFLQNPESTPGEARTFGGGNQTVNGIEIIVGANPTEFAAAMYEMSQSIIKTMKAYMCENIGVYFIDEYGNIGCKDMGDSTNVGPMPIQSFFIGDKKFGGLEEPDSNSISWKHAANWSDDLIIIKREDLDFDPLTELANAASEDEDEDDDQN